MQGAYESQLVTDSFPRRAQPNGPVTRSKQRNTLLVYLAVCLLGMLPLAFSLGAPLQALGLGLWFPGSGFIAAGGWHLLWLPLCLLLFAVALIAWFGSGNIVAPALVWAGSALAAAFTVGEDIAPHSPQWILGIVAGLAALMLRSTLLARKAAKQRRGERLRRLPLAVARVRERAAPSVPAQARELSERDLSAARYALDRGLRPVESLEGFEIIEQFQPSALRYQIFDLQYSLAHLQCQYTPNFQGYLAQAQRNLIEKILRPEIWGYWKWESLWGRLTTDFDPVVKDNIMLTGYYTICLSLYAANTGDHRYVNPGALEFWLRSGQRYPHSTHTIADALVMNFEQSAYCLYPCEPNWIYTFCNLQGMTALLAYDRVYGTQHAARLYERFRQSWQNEFTTDDGSVLPIRSSITGLTIPGLIGVSGDASGSVLAAALMPDIALRMWAQVRDEAVSFNDRGELELKLTGADKVDLGNYRKGAVMSYAVVLFAANEYGDREVADAALRWLDENAAPDVVDGVLTYRNASVIVNSALARARITRTGDWRRTVTQGPSQESRQGPMLTDAAYPDVLVARAMSTTGADLDLVLYPGVKPGNQRIKIERLTPHGSYQLSGSGRSDLATADAAGHLLIDVHLHGRTALHLAPRH